MYMYKSTSKCQNHNNQWKHVKIKMNDIKLEGKQKASMYKAIIILKNVWLCIHICLSASTS